MNLIKKDAYTIHSFDSIELASENSRFDYAIISDVLKAEIESKYYQDGTSTTPEGLEIPNMVNLNLVQSAIYQGTNSLFDVVVSLAYNDRNLAIENYENNKIDKSFKRKKFKVKSALPWLMNNYAFIYSICKENENIITESVPNGEDNLDVVAFMDNVSMAMRAIISANPEHMELIENPTRNN